MGNKKLIFISGFLMMSMSNTVHALSWAALFSKARAGFASAYTMSKAFRTAWLGSSIATASFFSSKIDTENKPVDPSKVQLTNWILKHSLGNTYLQNDVWGFLRKEGREGVESRVALPSIGLIGMFTITGKFSGEKPLSIAIKSNIEGIGFQKYVTDDAFTQCKKTGDATWDCTTGLSANLLQRRSGRWEFRGANSQHVS